MLPETGRKLGGGKRGREERGGEGWGAGRETETQRGRDTHKETESGERQREARRSKETDGNSWGGEGQGKIRPRGVERSGERLLHPCPQVPFQVAQQEPSPPRDGCVHCCSQMALSLAGRRGTRSSPSDILS